MQILQTKLHGLNAQTIYQILYHYTIYTFSSILARTLWTRGLAVCISSTPLL